jgi:phosphatidylinositol alpha-1,6-mannosyltransferase
MRLLLLASEYPPGPGGIGTHAHQVARHLRQLGWEMVVVAPQRHVSADRVRAFNASQPFDVVRLPAARGIAAKAICHWRVVCRCMKEYRPDVLLASGDRAVYLGALLARRYGLPWLAIEHGRVPAAWERAIKRVSLQQADVVVCVSRYTSQRMLSMGVRPRLVQVILNGADANRFRVLPEQAIAEYRAQLALNATRLLMTVGSVTERKGQDVVIRALPHILKRAPNTHYLSAGLPVKSAEFMRVANQLGVADHVHFLGSVDDDELVRLLNCCDVFVMTSRHTATDFEGFGIAVVEAALCAKPAVVTAQSGLAEAIIDQETGIGVPEEDEVATAEAILSLLNNEDQRQRMGEVARTRALNGQTWEHRVREYHGLLHRLLARGAPPGVAASVG